MPLPIQALLVVSYALVASAAGFAVHDFFPAVDATLVGVGIFFAALQAHVLVLRAGDRNDLLGEIELLRRSHAETLKELAELKLSLARRTARDN